MATASPDTQIATIDEYLTRVIGRNIIPAREVADILLEVRSILATYTVTGNDHEVIYEAPVTA